MGNGCYRVRHLIGQVFVTSSRRGRLNRGIIARGSRDILFQRIPTLSDYQWYTKRFVRRDNDPLKNGQWMRMEVSF